MSYDGGEGIEFAVAAIVRMFAACDGAGKVVSHGEVVLFLVLVIAFQRRTVA